MTRHTIERPTLSMYLDPEDAWGTLYKLAEGLASGDVVSLKQEWTADGLRVTAVMSTPVTFISIEGTVST